MSIAKGERFYLDLDSDEDENPNPRTRASQAAAPAFSFVADVKEKQLSAPKAPSAPTFKKTTNGFPAHKTRTRVSAFKQQRTVGDGQNHTIANTAPTMRNAPKHNIERENESLEAREKREIDVENRQKVAQMSPEEIERERQELFAGLNPSLIERLLKRSNLDVTREDVLDKTDSGVASPPPTKGPIEPTHTATSASSDGIEPAKVSSKPNKSVSFAPDPQPTAEDNGIKRPAKDDDRDPNDNLEAPILPDVPPQSTVHFPRPPQPPDLDPNDPSFLDNLHEKYFPDISYDPSSLSWMTPIDTSKPSSYSTDQSSLMISALRFSFKGALIPPTKATEIPVIEGLHHHGEAPEAAGYTIPELAILARSAVPAQRCMAYQTLGRILFRLGKGEFGSEGERKRYNVTAVDAEGGEIREKVDEDEDDKSGLAKGLWECTEEHNVIEILSEEANKVKGHMSSISYAQEALWNWRQGGGRKRKAV